MWQDGAAPTRKDAAWGSGYTRFAPAWCTTINASLFFFSGGEEDGAVREVCMKGGSMTQPRVLYHPQTFGVLRSAHMAIPPRSPRELLRDVALLKELPAADLKMLADAAEVRTASRGAHLFTEGAVAEGLFVVRTGEV